LPVVIENLRLIQQNSTAVFLDRKLSELATDGRPLSLSVGIETLANERMPIYTKWSELTVSVRGVEKTAKNISAAY
jgi:shikimate dehydrogenase